MVFDNSILFAIIGATLIPEKSQTKFTKSVFPCDLRFYVIFKIAVCFIDIMYVFLLFSLLFFQKKFIGVQNFYFSHCSKLLIKLKVTRKVIFLLLQFKILKTHLKLLTITTFTRIELMRL